MYGLKSLRKVEESWEIITKNGKKYNFKVTEKTVNPETEKRPFVPKINARFESSSQSILENTTGGNRRLTSGANLTLQPCSAAHDINALSSIIECSKVCGCG